MDGRALVCINEGVFSKHLIYGKLYEALKNDLEKRQVFIKGNTGKGVWIPSYCFEDPEHARIAVVAEFCIDDEITDESHGLVEVTLTMADGEIRWCKFCTPSYLVCLLDSQEFFVDSSTIFVASLTRAGLEDAVDQLTRSGRLFEVTRALDEG